MVLKFCVLLIKYIFSQQERDNSANLWNILFWSRQTTVSRNTQVWKLDLDTQTSNVSAFNTYPAQSTWTIKKNHVDHHLHHHSTGFNL